MTLIAYPMLRALAGRRMYNINVRLVNAVDECIIPAAPCTADELAAVLTQIEVARSTFAARYSLPAAGKPAPCHFNRRDENRPFGAENGEVDGHAVCLAPWRGLVVTHTGDAYVCSRMNTFRIGSINDTPLEALLGGERAEYIRQEMLAGRYLHCDPHCPANLSARIMNVHA